jgi:hypothetical protein
MEFRHYALAWVLDDADPRINDQEEAVGVV